MNTKVETGDDISNETSIYSDNDNKIRNKVRTKVEHLNFMFDSDHDSDHDSDPEYKLDYNFDSDSEFGERYDDFGLEDERQDNMLDKLSKKDLTKSILNDTQLIDVIEHIYKNTEIDYVYTVDIKTVPIKTKINTPKHILNHTQEMAQVINCYYPESRDKYDTPEAYYGNMHYHIIYRDDVFEQDKLMFPEECAVTLYNPCGINHDHRGSDLTEIELDFHSYYELPDNTYKSLCDGLYRIKSHKFDYWYELFSNAEIKIDDNCIDIKFRFDHGS